MSEIRSVTYDELMEHVVTIQAATTLGDDGDPKAFESISAQLSLPEGIVASLSGLNLEGENLRYTNLSGTHLAGGKMSRANLTEASLNAAWMQNIDLSDAIANNADLSETNLYGAKLQRANLRDANLTKAHISHADLSHTILTNALLNETDLQGAILRGAILSQADLTKSQLQDADLSNAKLQSSDLTSANFQRAILWKANLTGATMDKTIFVGAVLIDAIGVESRPNTRNAVENVADLCRLLETKKLPRTSKQAGLLSLEEFNRYLDFAQKLPGLRAADKEGKTPEILAKEQVENQALQKVVNKILTRQRMVALLLGVTFGGARKTNQQQRHADATTPDTGAPSTNGHHLGPRPRSEEEATADAPAPKRARTVNGYNQRHHSPQSPHPQREGVNTILAAILKNPDYKQETLTHVAEFLGSKTPQQGNGR